jgi:hypothetical protein
MKPTAIILALTLLASLPVLAQSSVNYKVEEYVFNSGGHPSNGTVMTSGQYRISLDAIGESITGTFLSSAQYRMEGGFGAAYPPPREVPGLIFTDSTTMSWSPEKSAGVYNLYRDLMSNLATLGYGDCEQYDISGPPTTDVDTPPLDDGYFYLVTAENRLGEEGTKGSDSDGSQRPNSSPCP